MKSHTTINQKISFQSCISHHLDAVTHFSTFHRTSNIYFTSCHSMHACLPLLLEASTHFPQIQTILSRPNLSSSLKSIFMQTTLLRHETVLLAQEKYLLAHCKVSPSCMSYNTNNMRCFHLCPVITFVNKSAGLSSDIMCPIIDFPIAADSQKP